MKCLVCREVRHLNDEGLCSECDLPNSEIAQMERRYLQGIYPQRYEDVMIERFTVDIFETRHELAGRSVRCFDARDVMRTMRRDTRFRYFIYTVWGMKEIKSISQDYWASPAKEGDISSCIHAQTQVWVVAEQNSIDWDAFSAKRGSGRFDCIVRKEN